MDRTEYLVFDTLELEYTLTQLLKKRNVLYLKGLNDEKLNDKIRNVQHKLINYANSTTNYNRK